MREGDAAEDGNKPSLAPPPLPFFFFLCLLFFLRHWTLFFFKKNIVANVFALWRKNGKKTQCELYKGFFREISQLGAFYFQEKGREEKPRKSM
jgi:hypothetical protein